MNIDIYIQMYVHRYMYASMGAPGRAGVADDGAERAHPCRLLRGLAFRTWGFWGYRGTSLIRNTNPHRFITGP